MIRKHRVAGRGFAEPLGWKTTARRHVTGRDAFEVSVPVHVKRRHVRKRGGGATSFGFDPGRLRSRPFSIRAAFAAWQNLKQKT